MNKRIKRYCWTDIVLMSFSACNSFVKAVTLMEPMRVAVAVEAVILIAIYGIIINDLTKHTHRDSTVKLIMSLLFAINIVLFIESFEHGRFYSAATFICMLFTFCITIFLWITNNLQTTFVLLIIRTVLIILTLVTFILVAMVGRIFPKIYTTVFIALGEVLIALPYIKYVKFLATQQSEYTEDRT